MSFRETLATIQSFLALHKKAVISAAVILIFTTFSLSTFWLMKPQQPQPSQSPEPSPYAEPTDTPFTTYKKPVLAPSERYDIYLVGDSMMHAFGPRGGVFNEILSDAYPDTFFEISNYAQANQSILLLPARLHEEVQADHDLLLVPIIKGNPDLIIVESFGYNPLSQFGITDGLKKQEEVLTEVMTTLTNRFPNTVIMFLAAIAPDKITYGQSVSQATADERWAQAEERIEYITNHIEYAKAHNIPLINAYQESLDTQGDGDTKYINPDDDIHPSAEGLAFMGRAMTKKIIDENIFPKQE